MSGITDTIIRNSSIVELRVRSNDMKFHRIAARVGAVPSSDPNQCKKCRGTGFGPELSDCTECGGSGAKAEKYIALFTYLDTWNDDSYYGYSESTSETSTVPEIKEYLDGGKDRAVLVYDDNLYEWMVWNAASKGHYNVGGPDDYKTIDDVNKLYDYLRVKHKQVKNP